jgi:hypothetical protein
MARLAERGESRIIRISRFTLRNGILVIRPDDSTPPIRERTNLVTRQERIDDFIHEGSPPNDQPLQILCEDHVGTYVIPFPCRWRDGLWENAKTSRRIEATVVAWRALNKTQR